MTETPPPAKRPPRWRKLLVRVALLCVFFWLITGLLIVLILPRRFGGPRPEPLPASLAGAEELRLTTSDNLKLGAWYTPGPKNVSVLVLHGRTASRTHRRPLHAHLQSLGHPTLSLTFRAHGDSEGSINDFGYSSRLDVMAGVEELRRRHPGNRLLICGASLGAAASIHAAKDLADKVDGYLFESPYTDLNTAAWNRCDHHLPPGLSHAAYASLRLWGPLLLPVNDSQSRPIDHVNDIPEGVPVVILASTADQHARIEESRALRDGIASHCKLIELPGGTIHGHLLGEQRDAYFAALAELIHRIE